MNREQKLDKFYDELKEIHKTHFKEQRFGQFCSNFFGWLATIKKKDLFFPENDQMLEYLKEYTHDNPLLHYSWELNGNKL